MRVELPYTSSQVMACWLDTDIDRIEIEHAGALLWDEMQQIKDMVWGTKATAIEIFPPKADVVNTGNYRHLWRIDKTAAAALPSLVDEGARQR